MPADCRLMQTGGTGTLLASPAQPECAACCPNSSKQRGEFGLHEDLLSQPAPAPHSFSPKPTSPLKWGTDQGTPQPAPGGYRQELALFMDTVAAVSLAAALVLHIQQRGRGDIHATSQHSVSTTGPRGGCRHRLHPAGWGAGLDTEGSQRQKTHPPIDRDRYIKKKKSKPKPKTVLR